MIAPSILNANNMNLGHDIEAAAQCGISRFHIDIMDGHFVPNLSYGPELVKNFKNQFPNLEAEVHLMSNNLDVVLPAFVKAGADLIEFHLEATNKPDSWLTYLHQHGLKAGLVISPDTPVDKVKPFLDKIDQLLIMSVYPGFGGQSFIEKSIDRIKQARELITTTGRQVPIEVDGGIDEDTVGKVTQAGADIYVAGSYIFKRGPIAEQINKLNKVISSCKQ
ncbi:ribulose-phosphate 3-epimerase [Lactobacillus colini]|uniref:Ribulose-phosphate 3-epimerase n=1 Tax=Lactobacillus colini TaxID=1819254 RepID=A0ABS4MB90_9LACO|nr:ribulose-phosphate 3-epimerase [Lactobacillus colini]MBP2056935.1 ribulose-phosphate 3-epimerase [Lactobacillus colini]